MSFEVVAAGRDEHGEFVTVWDGGRDKKGHREGIHTFYGKGHADFQFGSHVQLTLTEIKQAVEGEGTDQ